MDENNGGKLEKEIEERLERELDGYPRDTILRAIEKSKSVVGTPDAISQEVATAGVERLRSEGRDYDLSIIPGPLHYFESMSHVEIKGVRVPERFQARIYTETGWRFELRLRVQNGEPTIEGYWANPVEDVDADEAGKPMLSWAQEALTKLMIESGEGRMPASPRPRRPGSRRVPDEFLVEVVRLYDKEGLSLRAVAERMTGSKHGTTAKGWLEMAEERGLR